MVSAAPMLNVTSLGSFHAVFVQLLTFPSEMASDPLESRSASTHTCASDEKYVRYQFRRVLPPDIIAPMKQKCGSSTCQRHGDSFSRSIGRRGHQDDVFGQWFYLVLATSRFNFQ